MRYTLDSSGYVFAVAFGSYLDNCKEYTGEVPAGYRTLEEWATTAYIHAYYILDDNLTLDSERLEECQNRQAQEAIDYAPLVRKDLYENDEVLDSQYIRQVATGKVIVLENIKTIAPRVRITNINPYEYDTLTLQTQCKNMMPCTCRGQTISGVSFTKNFNGSVGVIGKATADIEYIISECNFTLKANEDYYLNLGGLNCELRFDDNGEIAQQYIGASGLINLPKNTEVSQVIIKISNGQSVNTTFYPQLEYGKSFSSYVEYKCKTLNIDFGTLVRSVLFPGSDLYPSDTLYPTNETTIDYIFIENGGVTVSVNGGITLLTSGAVGLFGSNSTIYANKDVMLEVEYSTNLISVDSLEFLQGKSTTTNRFRILNDGSIEAHNGYFSGRIEADSGYFKGEISWEQVTGNEDVATKTYVEGMGYQTASQVTQITKDTVTTSFVNALNVKAGSVDAEDITGTTIEGKTLKGIKGEIGGFTIGTSSIYNKTTSISSSTSGVYVGTDGINLGGGKAVITSAGKTTFKEIEINGSGSIDLAYGGKKMSLDYSGIKFGSTSWDTTITNDKVAVYNSYIDRDGLHVSSSASLSYYTNIKQNEISFGSGADAIIKHGSTEVVSMGSSHFWIEAKGVSIRAEDPTPSYVRIAGYYDKLGFFNQTGTTKQQVSSLATSATLGQCVAKLNELISVLDGYGLV